MILFIIINSNGESSCTRLLLLVIIISIGSVMLPIVLLKLIIGVRYNYSWIWILLECLKVVCLCLSNLLGISIHHVCTLWLYSTWHKVFFVITIFIMARRIYCTTDFIILTRIIRWSLKISYERVIRMIYLFILVTKPASLDLEISNRVITLISFTPRLLGVILLLWMKTCGSKHELIFLVLSRR